MRVLVVGGGGREHALVWQLQQDDPAATIFAAPGNPGTAKLAKNLPIAATDLDGLVDAAVANRVDLVVVGPEAPLAAGLVDRLQARGRPAFGPSAAAARIESSKAFAKTVLTEAGVPTAASATFSAVALALDYIARHAEPLVVKASGLAAGKGVVVCATRKEAAETARAFLEGKLGSAGEEIVVEDFLAGEELSVLALTDGEQIVILPPAQDHKRLGEGDTGPNTGGMGAYTPVSLATPSLLERVRRQVFEPTLAGLAAHGTPYSGVLYAGLMVAVDGTPWVLEFNCRFGDPETQVLLPVLPRGSTAHLAAIAAGAWRPESTVLTANRAAVTTVLAARGYPDRPEKGAVIDIPALPPDVLLFHAGTIRDAGGALRVAGGRVLNVTALAPTVAAAAAASRAACERITFDGKTWRGDIARREIDRSRDRAGAA
jgi:phosphoribosylamine---glycine ligase